MTLALEDTADPFAAARAVRWLRHEKRIRELEEAKKAAGYQSGARGLKARKELREQEEGIRASQEM